MISDGITQLIIYKEIEKNKYLYLKNYDICVGTSYKELGLSTQYYFIDISTFVRDSVKKISINDKCLSISYEFPKLIEKDLFDFVTSHIILDFKSNPYIVKPIIVIVDSDFKFDLINEYIKKYSEYGVKEND